MPTTFSASLRLSLLGTGENSGTWGNITNDNLGALIEQAITGVQSIAMADSDSTLIALNGAVDEARNAVITMTGSLSAQRSVIVPFAEKTYVIRNLTTGGQTILVKTSTGSGVTIPNGNTATIYCDATDVFRSAPLFNQSTNVVTATTFTGNVVASTGSFTSMPTVNGVSILPSGVILMWSGSVATIPAGFGLCDGTNSTPDLRDRFVIGAGAAQSPGATGGSSTSTTNSAGAHSHGGSAANHTLTEAQMPSHQHGGTTDVQGAHQHRTGNPDTGGGSYYGLAGGEGGNISFPANRDALIAGLENNLTYATSVAGAHAHNIATDFRGSSQPHNHAISSDGTHNHTVSTVPPFFALAFIMKL